MTFARQFADATTDEIEVDGKVLRQIWRTSVEAGQVSVTRVSATTARPQGLVVDADVDLTVDGFTGRRLELWTHTAPATVKIDVDDATELRIWNVWADNEMTQAWIGWAALHAETNGSSTRLACRDGHGNAPDAVLEDLIVDITIESQRR